MWIEERNSKYRMFDRVTLPDGRRKRVSVAMEKNTPKERKAARESLQRRVAELSRNVSDFRLSELIADYLEAKRPEWKESTYIKADITLNQTLLDVFGDVRIKNVTAGFLRSRLREKTDDPTRFNGYAKMTRALFSWAYENDYISSPDCYRKLKNMKDTPGKLKVKDKYLELDEYERLLASMHSDKWRLVTEFLVLSGLRIGEFIALDVADVDFEAKEIRVSKTFSAVTKSVTSTKTLESTRTVHMQPELLRCAQELRKVALRIQVGNGIRSDYFLASADGTRTHYAAYCKYLRTVTENVLGRKLTPHALRHSHVALMAAQGMSIEVLARRLGHSDIRITKEVYFHVTKGLKEADAKLYDAVSLR